MNYIVYIVLLLILAKRANSKFRSARLPEFRQREGKGDGGRTCLRFKFFNMFPRPFSFTQESPRATTLTDCKTDSAIWEQKVKRLFIRLLCERVFRGFEEFKTKNQYHRTQNVIPRTENRSLPLLIAPFKDKNQPFHTDKCSMQF